MVKSASAEERDRKSIEVRRDKKKNAKGNGKATKSETFSFQWKERKNRTHAEREMPTRTESPTNRLFSVRAWDRNGDEVWSDDSMGLDKFTSEWPNMKKWALVAKYGEIYTTTKNVPMSAEFFFRRIS